MITVKAKDVAINVGDTVPTSFDVVYENLLGTDSADAVFSQKAAASVDAGVDGKTKGTYEIHVTAPAINTDWRGKYALGDKIDSTLTVKEKSNTGGNSGTTGGGSSSGGSGGGGGKSSTTTTTTPTTDAKSETTTTTNPDGSTTTTVTNPDGSSVETTIYPDGTKTVTETDENGAQTITETRPDGTEVRTEISRRGEVTSDIKLPEGAEDVTVTIPIEDRPTTGTVAAIVNPDGTREILLDAIIGNAVSLCRLSRNLR